MSHHIICLMTVTLQSLEALIETEINISIRGLYREPDQQSDITLLDL